MRCENFFVFCRKIYCVFEYCLSGEWEMSGNGSMKQKAASPDWLVLLLTGLATIIVGILSFKLISVGRWLHPLILTGVWLYCYIYAPRSYEIRGNFLIVNFRIGSKRFGPIVSCQTTKGRVIAGLRVFGNGGLFGYTGWYRNLRDGLHRSYVTHRKKLILLETKDGKKILISPGDPQGFVDGVKDTPGIGSKPADIEIADSDAVNYDVIDRLVE